MPQTICETCCSILDFTYRFKQMCKKAETRLKQFQSSGIWPSKLELPIFPKNIIEVCLNFI